MSRDTATTAKRPHRTTNKPAAAQLSLAEVMAALEAAGSERTRRTYARHRVTLPMFGVSLKVWAPCVDEAGQQPCGAGARARIDAHALLRAATGAAGANMRPRRRRPLSAGSVPPPQHAGMEQAGHQHRRGGAVGEADADSIRGLLQRVRQSTQAGTEQVSLDEVVSALGSRAFGPLLLLLGLVVISPIGDIPGASALVGLIIALVAAQLLANRGEPWLPQWALRRSVRTDRVERSLGWLDRPARFADRHLHPRLCFLSGRIGRFVIAAGCVVAALLLVPLEFVPFASTVVGTALILFSVALVTHDGLAALIAFAFTASAIGLIVWHFA